MKLTAKDLKEANVADEVVPESLGGAQDDPESLYKALDQVLEKTLAYYDGMSRHDIRKDRLSKFRNI